MEHQRSTVPRGLSVWADRPVHGLRLMASTILCQFTLTPRFLAKRKVDDDDEMLPSTGSPSHCFHATLSAIFWVFSVLASFMCRCIATTTTIHARHRPDSHADTGDFNLASQHSSIQAITSTCDQNTQFQNEACSQLRLSRPPLCPSKPPLSPDSAPTHVSPYSAKSTYCSPSSRRPQQRRPPPLTESPSQPSNSYATTRSSWPRSSRSCSLWRH